MLFHINSFEHILCSETELCKYISRVARLNVHIILLDILLCIFSDLFFETGSRYVAQAGFKLTM